MNINILAGGPADLLPNLKEFETEHDLWVGVDRGALSLLASGIEPFAALGDFDSITNADMGFIKQRVKQIYQFQPEKDETDMEIALTWALEQDPELIRVFGATGGRLDHFFANIQLLIKPILNHNFIPIEIYDQKNIVFMRAPGSYVIKKIPAMKYISFIPISEEVLDLSLSGFKYPLKNQYIPLGSTLCISNELINDIGNFSFSQGILMVVRSKD